MTDEDGLRLAFVRAVAKLRASANPEVRAGLGGAEGAAADRVVVVLFSDTVAFTLRLVHQVGGRALVVAVDPDAPAVRSAIVSANGPAMEGGGTATEGSAAPSTLPFSDQTTVGDLCHMFQPGTRITLSHESVVFSDVDDDDRSFKLLELAGRPS